MRRNKILRQAERHLELLNEKIYRPLPNPKADIHVLRLMRPAWLDRNYFVFTDFSIDGYEGHFTVILDDVGKDERALFICTYEEGVQVWPPQQKLFFAKAKELEGGGCYRAIVIPFVNQLWQHTSPTDWTEYLQKQREHRARFR